MEITATVLRAFRDGDTKKYYRKGDAFPGTKARCEEINARGKDKPYLALDTPKPAAAPADSTKSGKGDK